MNRRFTAALALAVGIGFVAGTGLSHVRAAPPVVPPAAPMEVRIRQLDERVTVLQKRVDALTARQALPGSAPPQFGSPYSNIPPSKVIPLGLKR